MTRALLDTLRLPDADALVSEIGDFVAALKAPLRAGCS